MKTLLVFIGGAVIGFILALLWGQFRPPMPFANRTPSADSVKIIGLSPPIKTPLKRGETITVSVTVKYELKSAQNGQIGLVIQDEKGKGLDSGSAEEYLKKGSGQVILKDTVKVPKTGEVMEVFTALFTEGPLGSSSAVDIRSYKLQ